MLVSLIIFFSSGTDHYEATSKSSAPKAVETVSDTKVKLNNSQQATQSKTNKSVNSPEAASVEERTEEKPSNSQERAKEGKHYSFESYNSQDPHE